MSADHTDHEVPVAEVMHGLRVHRLPRGWMPVAGIVLVKCLDEDGDPRWALRQTDLLNEEELLGALMVRTDLLRRDLVGDYRPEPHDEE